MIRNKKWLFLYLFPVIVLAMWIEYQNCPTGHFSVYLIFALPMLLLGFLSGRFGGKRELLLGNALQLAVSMGILLVMDAGNVTCAKCGVAWVNYFKPFPNVYLAFLGFFIIGLLLQWIPFVIGRAEQMDKS